MKCAASEGWVNTSHLTSQQRGPVRYNWICVVYYFFSFEIEDVGQGGKFSGAGVESMLVLPLGPSSHRTRKHICVQIFTQILLCYDPIAQPPPSSYH